MATTFTMATLVPCPRLELAPFHRQAFSHNHSLSPLPSLLSSSFSSQFSCPPKLKVSLPSTSSVSEVVVEEEYEKSEKEKFDWYSEWYAVAPLCDLDEKVPHGIRILGIDVVVWWDRNEGQWKVFEDSCPHRLAPLSEGRIDAWGRLQCVYHGWCFNGTGNCQLIPQAPPDGPPVHTFKKACVASYPCTVQNDILWFWPSSDPQHRDILARKQPPYIPELSDPSYARSLATRDVNYGYEVLTENLMDPAHVHYAHYGVMRVVPDILGKRREKPKADREGGRPLDMTVQKLDKTGFWAKQEVGASKFIAPCVFYFEPTSVTSPSSDAKSTSISVKDPEGKQRRHLLIFMCIPVSPGKSRLIWTHSRNFGVWINKIVPRWMFHIEQNLILDSDMYLLHVEEHKIKEIGAKNWQKACFVPTKSDALVVGYRKWLNKYCGGQIDWRNKFDGTLPPTPPREVLMDRYWTHVVKCSSCKSAYKGLKITETMLQIVSFALVGVVAVVRRGAMSSFQKCALFATALAFFAASKWLSNFIYKIFHFHDYNHALV